MERCCGCAPPHAVTHAHIFTHTAKHLDLEQVKLLLQHKADPKIVDARGNSALHFAAMSALDWKPHADFMIKDPVKFVFCFVDGVALLSF